MVDSVVADWAGKASSRVGGRFELSGSAWVAASVVFRGSSVSCYVFCGGTLKANANGAGKVGHVLTFCC